jgi:hypothetical protein
MTTKQLLMNAGAGRTGMLLKRITFFALVLILAPPGCIVVGGYSSGRGWFIWPGTIGIFVVVVVLLLLLRSRR